MLNEENILWLEQVFRENVGKGKEEFTLDEFKKIVPSKNVSTVLRTKRFVSFVNSGLGLVAPLPEVGIHKRKQGSKKTRFPTRK